MNQDLFDKGLQTRREVLGVPLPPSNRFFVGPIRHGDAEPVGASGGFDAQITRHRGGQFEHPRGGGFVAVVVLATRLGAGCVGARNRAHRND